MKKLIRGVLAVLVASVALSATEAFACDVSGVVVCDGNAVQGVTLRIGSQDFAMTVDGGAVSGHVAYAGTYDVIVVIGGVEYAQGTATCGAGGIWSIDLGTLQVDAPVCVPVTADCSPGFYKNHPETWCGADLCFSGEKCDELLQALASRGADSAGTREGAKGELDACFGTAQASPCVDDDS